MKLEVIATYVILIYQQVLSFHSTTSTRNSLIDGKYSHCRPSLICFAKRRTRISPIRKDGFDNDEVQDDKNKDESIDNDPTFQDITPGTTIEPNNIVNAERTVVFRRKSLIEDLEEDILNFSNSEEERKQQLIPALDPNDLIPIEFQSKSTTSKNDDIGSKIRDVISGILIADFALIIVFLLWFIAASISKEGFGNAFLLERFQDIFQPVIQPALGLLMAGSVLSGVIKGNDGKETK